MNVCCDVGGNGEFVGDRISFIPPTAFDSACRGIINRFGVPQRLVRSGSNGQLTVREVNAADAPEQPAADSTVGVVVQGFVWFALGTNAGPGFPHRVGAFVYAPSWDGQRR